MVAKYTPGYKPPKSYLQFNGDGTITLVGKAWKDAYPPISAKNLPTFLTKAPPRRARVSPKKGA